ncbi:MAG: hypothetical protein M1815_004271 [Lichina confinis]|nr:MAG: hypothetical protein M1815_004271 [Lichina confinis]
MFSILLVLLLQCCAIVLARPASDEYFRQPAEGRYLWVTTLFGRKGQSTIECWKLPNPFILGTDPGIEGNLLTTLGPVERANLAIIRPGFNGGLHVAPKVQFVIFPTGLSKATVPGSDDYAWVAGGGNGLVLAADTAEVSRDGHTTIYPSNEATVGYALPIPGNKPPTPLDYVNGACPWHKKEPKYKLARKQEKPKGYVST